MIVSYIPGTKASVMRILVSLKRFLTVVLSAAPVTRPWPVCAEYDSGSQNQKQETAFRLDY